MPTTVSTFSLDELIPAFPSDDFIEMQVKLSPGTYAKGTIIGEITASPGTYKAYASGNSDGSQIPKAALRYACTVAGDGTISNLTELGEVRTTVPAYFADVVLRTQDLTGLDANAVTAWGARLISGTVASGLLRVP